MNDRGDNVGTWLPISAIKFQPCCLQQCLMQCQWMNSTLKNVLCLVPKLILNKLTDLLYS